MTTTGSSSATATSPASSNCKEGTSRSTRPNRQSAPRSKARFGGPSSLSDQLVECAADVLVGKLHVPLRTVVAQEHETALLVTTERSPRALAIDPHRFRRQHLVDDVRRPPGQAERSLETERHRRPMCDRLVRSGSFERVRERVAEVEDVPLAAVVRIAETDRGLERRAATDELDVRKLPQ